MNQEDILKSDKLSEDTVKSGPGDLQDVEETAETSFSLQHSSDVRSDKNNEDTDVTSEEGEITENKGKFILDKVEGSNASMPTEEKRRSKEMGRGSKDSGVNPNQDIEKKSRKSKQRKLGVRGKSTETNKEDGELDVDQFFEQPALEEKVNADIKDEVKSKIRLTMGEKTLIWVKLLKSRKKRTPRNLLRKRVVAADLFPK